MTIAYSIWVSIINHSDSGNPLLEGDFSYSCLIYVLVALLSHRVVHISILQSWSEMLPFTVNGG